ncbi:MAG: hypothetical protein DHS20C21_08490 [Gemmatimonadota bacterium]|nr:MAG: hypothetical protein DHS20C21_08490 [Gemmatimonadota bacterium]
MIRTVADVMAVDLVTFHPDTPIFEAIRTLLDRRISGAPVVDSDHNLVGILSRKDCLRIAFVAGYHHDGGGWVRDFMVTDVKTMEADTDLISAAQIFLDSHFRRFPVMRDGRLVGQVSRHDILNALTAEI